MNCCCKVIRQVEKLQEMEVCHHCPEHGKFPLSPAKDQTCPCNLVPPRGDHLCGKESVSGEGEYWDGFGNKFMEVLGASDKGRALAKLQIDLAKFIRTLAQKEYERGREEGKKIADAIGSYTRGRKESREDTLDEIETLLAGVKNKDINKGWLMQKLKANRDI